MKLIHRATIIGGLALAVGATGCADITGVNKNPNAPEDVAVGPLFTRAAVDAVTRWLGNGFNLRGMEFMAQHLAEVQYPFEDQYTNLQASNTAGTFNNAYTQELVNLRVVVDKSTAANQPGIVGPARVLQSWSLGYLTDMWGDVPYTDALKGDAADAVLLPKYDAQKDVYDSLFKALAGAVTSMEGASAGLAQADPIYGGDLLKWQRFANSLRARMAIRLVNVDPTKADVELKAALAAPGGVFASVTDNARLAWPGDGVFDNPWWSGTFRSRDDHRMSRTLMDIMVASNDPRVPVYAQPVGDSSLFANGYGGMPNGLTHDSAGTYLAKASRPGAIFYAGATPYGTYGSPANTKTPSNLMTYAEVSFIKAEAAELGIGGLNPGQAKGFYEDGIKASLNQWGITDAAKISAFLADPAIAYQGGNDGLKQIATQKWVALFTDGAQAWAEWRRTCQPATVKAGPEAMVKYVPRRLQYSTTELSANRANVQAAIARQGADNFATRVYWDTKPTASRTYVNDQVCAGAP
jgi:hypothetical protein